MKTPTFDAGTILHLPNITSDVGIDGVSKRDNCPSGKAMTYFSTGLAHKICHVNRSLMKCNRISGSVNPTVISVIWPAELGKI